MKALRKWWLRLKWRLFGLPLPPFPNFGNRPQIKAYSGITLDRVAAILTRQPHYGQRLGMRKRAKARAFVAHIELRREWRKWHLMKREGV